MKLWDYEVKRKPDELLRSKKKKTSRDVLRKTANVYIEWLM